MEAIILAGGFGTRLRSVLADVPKPMAPIQDNKPFLAYLLDYLKAQGVQRVILSVHYLREQIETYFKTAYQGIAIEYAVEDEPLGTGGAIAKALQHCETSKSVFVLNGDTFLKLDYREMLAKHEQESPLMTMALRKVDDCHRYGAVLVEREEVVGFNAQGISGSGLINAGIYLINPQLFNILNYSPVSKDVFKPFSFEKDFLFPYTRQLKAKAFVVDDYFIDIGIPEDYARAKAAFPIR